MADSMLLCARCAVVKSKSEFSKRQLKKGDGVARCQVCLDVLQAVTGGEHTAEDAEAGHCKRIKLENAAWQHTVTGGQVTGKVYRAPGSRTRDAACRPSKVATAAAAVLSMDFQSIYSLTGPKALFKAITEAERARLQAALADAADATETVAAVKRQIAAYEQHLIVFNKLHPREAHREPWWTSEAQLTDFISTLPRQHGRQQMAAWPVEAVSDARPIGSFDDAPYVTDFRELKFSMTGATLLMAPFQVSRMPVERVVRDELGTAIFQDGVLVAGRARQQLDPKYCRELINIYRELDVLRPFLQRGVGVANVCANFVATGFKCDQNTRQCLVHNPACGHDGSDESIRRVRETWNKLQTMYTKHVHAIAMDSFGCILAPVLGWMHEHNVRLYAAQVSGVTFGDLFWPRSHLDPDAWYTILVCLDTGPKPTESNPQPVVGVVSGGDFAFARAGWVLECKHGDVLIYNGMELHGTTEFHVASEHAGRVFVALYMNMNTVQARALTMNMPVKKPKVDFGFL